MTAPCPLHRGRFPFPSGHLAMVKRILDSIEGDHHRHRVGAVQPHGGEPFTAGERTRWIQRSPRRRGISLRHRADPGQRTSKCLGEPRQLPWFPTSMSVYTNSTSWSPFGSMGWRSLAPVPGPRTVCPGPPSAPNAEGRGLGASGARAVARYIKEIDGVERIRETHKYSTPYGTREIPRTIGE